MPIRMAMNGQPASGGRSMNGPFSGSPGPAIGVERTSHKNLDFGSLKLQLVGPKRDTLEDEKLRNTEYGCLARCHAGTPDMMSKAHDAFPEAEMHWD